MSSSQPTHEVVSTPQPTSSTDYEYVTVEGGVLVYEPTYEPRAHLNTLVRTGRDLVGVADVSDWEALRSELANRGHDVGAIHHLPVLERGA